MAQKYYSSHEAAEVLSVSLEEIRQMLERRELHGYRDGADWKFKVEEIDRLVQERGTPSAEPSGEQDNVLLSEVELGQSGPGSSGTVIGMEQKAAPDGAAPLSDSDLKLAGSNVKLDEAPKPAAAKPDLDSQVTQFEELDLTLDEDLTLEGSSVTGESKPAPAKPSGDSAVDLSGKTLDDDDVVLGGGGTGSDITIGGDSGISLVDAADSGLSLEEPPPSLGTAEESLELGEDDLALASDEGPTALKADDEFLLTPLEETADAEESESGSQVIALDTEGDESPTQIAGGAGPAMPALLDEDLGAEAAPGLAAAPLGTVGGVPIGAGLPAGTVVEPSAALPEAPYTTLNIVSLAFCAVLLLFCGMFMYDLARNMWSWEAPYGVSRSMMDTILNWFE